MAINLVIYQRYTEDSLWSAKVLEEPMNNIQMLLPPNCFFKSEFDEKWNKCIMDYPADIRLPTFGQVVISMKFESNVDTGLDYNKITMVYYKSIKYGKKFVCNNPNPKAELTRKDFDHDTWETYEKLDDELIWQIGDTSNKFILQIISKKSPPIECMKNYETCELYIYKPTKIVFHMDEETTNKIIKLQAEGKGFIPLPKQLQINQDTPGQTIVEEKK